MKTTLLTLLVCATMLTSNAQVILQPATPHATTGKTIIKKAAKEESNAGYYYDFSNGLGDFKTYDGDGGIPHESIAAYGFTEGSSWLPFIYANTDYIVGSNSFHSPSKRANDWLISPAILVGEDHMLTFTIRTISYLGDSKTGQYTMMLSTTGNEIEDFTIELDNANKVSSKEWVARGYDLSAYEGDTIYVAIINTSINKDMLAVNDFFVGIPEAAEAAIAYSHLQADTTEGQKISIYVTAGLAEPITSVVATLTSGDFSTVLDMSDNRIEPGATVKYQFAEPLPAPTAGVGQQFDVEIVINNVDTLNGAGEIFTEAYRPFKRLFTEELTGTWCAWCVRGHVNMHRVEEENPERFVGAATHINDPMEYESYSNYLTSQIGSAAPAARMARATEMFDPEDLGEVFNELGDIITLADLDIKAEWSDEAHRGITLTSTTTFAMSAQNYNARLEYLVVEDDVNIHDNALYNQQNGPSGSGNTEMDGYETLPKMIPGGLMFYDDVVRHVISDKVGVGINGSVPQTVEKDMPYEHTVTFDVPASVLSVAKCEFIVLLIDSYTGMVLNAAKCRIDSETVKAEKVELFYNNKPLEEGSTIDFGSGKSVIVTARVSPYDTADKSVTWSSSNEAAVKVDKYGQLLAVEVGEAVITATTSDGGLKASYTVNCTSGIEGVAIDDIEVVVNGTDLVVRNVTAGSQVAIYATDGKLLDKQVAGGNEVRYANMQAGVYLVVVDGISHKVII